MNRVARYSILFLCLVMPTLLGLSAAPARGAGTITVVPKGQQGCAPGTIVAGSNKVFNGDFAIPAGAGPDIDPAAGFTSELPNVGPDTYPDDNMYGGGFSIITGGFNPSAGIVGRTFPGDPVRAVVASQTYFYSNPNKDINGQDVYHPQSNPTKDYATLWTQQVTLTVGTTYNFFAYFDNLLDPDSFDNNVADPQIELRVNDTPAGPPIVVAKSPDQWVPVQFSFTLDGAPGDIGTQTTVALEIRDYANTIVGDDFAMTGVNLKQCVSGLGVAFTNLLPVSNGDGTYDIPFVVTLRNYGVDPLPLSRVQVAADLSPIANAVETFAVRDLASSLLSVNSGFDGITDKSLLIDSPSNQLGSGATAMITFTARIKPSSGSGSIGPFVVQVVASAQAGVETSGANVGDPIIVSDLSTPGTNPDPNPGSDPDPGVGNNGGFKDPEVDVPTPIYIVPLQTRLPLIAR